MESERILGNLKLGLYWVTKLKNYSRFGCLSFIFISFFFLIEHYDYLNGNGYILYIYITTFKSAHLTSICEQVHQLLILYHSEGKKEKII